MFDLDRALRHLVPVALLAALLAPVESVPAAAADARAPRVSLRYRATDLDSAHGVSILYRRIRSAASSVCGTYDNALLEEKALWNECVDQAVASAVAAVHSETLTAYHGRRLRAGKRPWIDVPSLAARRVR